MTFNFLISKKKQAHHFKKKQYEKSRFIQPILHLSCHLWLNAVGHFKPISIYNLGRDLHDYHGLCIQGLQMIQFKLNQKPLSVNLAWQGKRFKTPAYKSYEKEILLRMPAGKVATDQMLRVEFFFGFSNKASDLDNPVKLLLDLAQKKYGFNDSHVYELNVRKCIVKKGEDFIQMGIYNLLPF